MSVQNPFDADQEVCSSYSLKEGESPFPAVVLFVLVFDLLIAILDILSKATKVLSSSPEPHFLLSAVLFSLKLVVGLLLLGILIVLVDGLILLYEEYHVELMILNLSIGLSVLFMIGGGLLGTAPNFTKKVVSVLAQESEIALVCESNSGPITVSEPYEVGLVNGKFVIYLSRDSDARVEARKCQFVSAKGLSSILKKQRTEGKRRPKMSLPTSRPEKVEVLLNRDQKVLSGQIVSANDVKSIAFQRGISRFRVVDLKTGEYLKPSDFPISGNRTIAIIPYNEAA